MRQQQNLRLIKKIQRLDEAKELIKFYQDKYCNLPLKKVLAIRKAQNKLYEGSQEKKKDFSESLTKFSAKQEYLKKIYSSKNIGKFLYYISLYKGLQLTIQQQRHFDLKVSCDKGENYRIADCSFCCTRHFIKTSCNSFFCEECRNYMTSKIKRKAKSYLWNCNHFFATFTLPPEIQREVYSWNRYFDKRYYKDKDGNIRKSEIYYPDLVYKSVEQAIKIYCKKYDLEIGYILMPHSYGSSKLNWFFHVNALISSKALRINPDKKFQTQRVTKTNNRRLKKEKISLANFRFIFGDDYSGTIDYQFNYDELRKIYKDCLEKNFKKKIRATPQINFAIKKDKRTGKKTIYISYKKAVSKILNYFRHIPINLKNIIKIEKGFVYYQTSKAKKEKKVYNKPFTDFFYLILQHIPPSHFRTVRQYGLYSNSNQKRLKYPTSPSKPKKPFRCDICKAPITKRDYIGMVHMNTLVWINPEKRNRDPLSILDCRDFVFRKSLEIDERGKVKQACEPPSFLKPPSPPKFPEKEEDYDSEESLTITGFNGFEFDFKLQEFNYSKKPDPHRWIHRLMDLKENKKIKLNFSERINLAITGKC